MAGTTACVLHGQVASGLQAGALQLLSEMQEPRTLFSCLDGRPVCQAERDGVRVAHADAGHEPGAAVHLQPLLHHRLALHGQHGSLRMTVSFKMVYWIRGTADRLLDAISPELAGLPCRDGRGGKGAKLLPVCGILQAPHRRSGPCPAPTWVGCSVVGTSAAFRMGSPMSTHTCSSSIRLAVTHFTCILVPSRHTRSATQSEVQAQRHS